MNRDNHSLMRCVLTDTAAADLEKRYEHRQRLWYDGPYGGSIAFDKVMEREVGLYIAYNFSDIPTFIRKAKIRGRLRHPHLLPVLDFGVTADNLPYFTEPFVGSLSLDSLLRTWNGRQPFPLRRLVGILTGVCRAVAYTHEKCLCHLDLKPSEVHVDDSLSDAFVTGGWEEVVVSPSANLGQQLGFDCCTPAYAAPEQVQYSQRELLQRSLWRVTDVYGLGGILYFALYGTPPNQVLPGADRSVVNLLQALMSGQGVLRPAQLRPALQTSAKAVSDLERIAFKALEREPHHRYQTVGEMAQELEKWLERARKDS